MNDTLSLLDSMLANAPIGLAFVDHNGRVVRVNQIFADLTGVSVSHHLGRTLPDLLPQTVATEMEGAVQRVFSKDEPVRNLELNGEGGKAEAAVDMADQRLPGAHDTERGALGGDHRAGRQRPQAQRGSTAPQREARRNRAPGRFDRARDQQSARSHHQPALSAAQFQRLPDPAQKYVTMAEYEVHRIAEITQQTLRFYRQPTQPARATMEELLDSVLNLYQGRINASTFGWSAITSRAYLFCFAGEIRQVFANLVGNSIDASSNGGRLVVRRRRSRDWKNPEQTGIRFAVADTGAGMEPEVREHISGLLHDQGSDGNRAGAMGKPGNHPQTPRIGARAQPHRGEASAKRSPERSSRFSFPTIRI